MYSLSGKSIPLRPHKLKQQEHGTNGNGAIGHIERGERPAAAIHLHKIRYRASDDPIVEITDRASQDKAQCNTRDPCEARLPRFKRAPTTKPALRCEMPIRTTARIIGLPSASIPNAAPGFSVCTIRNRPGNHRNRVQFAQMPADVKLRHAIEQQSPGEPGQRQPAGPRIRPSGLLYFQLTTTATPSRQTRRRRKWWEIPDRYRHRACISSSARTCRPIARSTEPERGSAAGFGDSSS